MSNFFKKHVPVTIGALMATSPLFVSADMDARLNKLESQMKDSGTQTARGNFGAKTASASPDVDGYGFYLTGDALLWQMMTDDDVYATTNTASAGVEGSMKHADFKWSWGFKVGLGYYAEHDNWDTGFKFTWFKTHANDSTTGTLGTIYPLHGNPEVLATDTESYSAASTSWHFSYYDLGWQLGRDFFVSKYLTLRPNVSVRSTWMYNTRTDNASGAASTNFRLNNSADFWGVGPGLGVDAKMYFGRNFSLFGSTGTSLLWGRFKPTFQSTDLFAGTTDDNVSGTFHRIVPNVMLALGLGYDTNFYDDNFNFGIKVGYESNYFFNAVQMIEFTEGSGDGGASSARPVRSNGDLMLHGFNLNLSFSF